MCSFKRDSFIYNFFGSSFAPGRFKSDWFNIFLDYLMDFSVSVPDKVDDSVLTI